MLSDKDSKIVKIIRR